MRLNIHGQGLTVGAADREQVERRRGFEQLRTRLNGEE